MYKERIYFISDCEGVANIYSYKTDGTNLKQHTFHNDFYVRWPKHYKNLVVYQLAGDLWTLDIETGLNKKLDIQIRSCGYSTRKQFMSPVKNLTGYSLSPKQDKILITSRGVLAIAPKLGRGCYKNWRVPRESDTNLPTGLGDTDKLLQ